MRDQEEYSFNQGAEDQPRQTMNKNYRVGRIKYYAKQTTGPRGIIPAAILLDIIEWCGVRWSGYNLWVSVDEKHEVSQDDVGSWAEVGFYIKGSFREANGQIFNNLKMRHLTILGGDLTEDIVLGEDDFIKEEDMLTIPVSAANTAREIYQGTLYSPKRVEEEQLTN